MASTLTRITRAYHQVHNCSAVSVYLAVAKHLQQAQPGVYQVYLHHTGPSNYMVEVVNKRLIDPVAIYLMRGLAEPVCMLNILPALGLDELVITSYQAWVNSPKQLELVYQPEPSKEIANHV